MTPIVPSPAAPDDGPPHPPGTAPPVLVAGAGPVGLCTALTLARFGVPTLVLEAAEERGGDYFRMTGSKAICFQRDVLDAFDRLGVAAPLIAEGVTWTTARTYYRHHEVRTVTFPAMGGEVRLPPWINISQARVEQELLRRAAADPLVEIRYRHEVTGLRQDADGVTVEAATPDGAVAARGTHLVGADGPHSTVRRLLGVGFPGESFADRFLICDIRADLPFPNERRFFFDPEWNPGRQVLVHQCPDSTWRIDWQVPDGYDIDAERATGALDTRIRKIVGEQPYEIVWSSVYRFHERCAESFRRDRVFLAGDAAHLYAPFGARGLNSGVHDAENLGWKLACARRVSPAAAERLLGSYHDERWAAAQENLRVTGDTMRFLVPHGEADSRRRRETLERAVTDPAARDRIDSGKLAEPYWYPDSPLTTPPEVAEPIPTEAGRPRPPVPGVICPDGPAREPGGAGVTRLRRLLGPGFTLLTADAGRARALAAAAEGLPVAVAAHALDDIDVDGALAEALRAGTGTVHVVRPDAHLCAVLDLDAAGTADTETVLAAVRRACGEEAPALIQP
ncbi:pentachlorophenol monooxygenase/3-(3-hydroxy-phenyl)propionate hydroxylase [Nocardiopsis mwathae]|uniref:Pentachlorophenol monooxygenase/3-(3-hydroxy-phenyl)propionate hydroxylase n=1 Tax=Nocardiopsis mwathae TaxID=1472723 RepID=A0A7X0D3X5_9ACTN|nr:FAD-dependent monooxygenase [Nocardiopsis mwathae]MBB6170687.1 pentachlorophenol monooxygenase/3-(3-hydroxy-phenyl)propionate hydroxylase [Nocardiopsis mwathae]